MRNGILNCCSLTGDGDIQSLLGIHAMMVSLWYHGSDHNMLKCSYKLARVSTTPSQFSVAELPAVACCSGSVLNTRVSTIPFQLLLSCQQLPVVAQCYQSLHHPLPVVAELPAVACCSSMLPESLHHPLPGVAKLPESHS
jgi:hypothetical protein